MKINNLLPKLATRGTNDYQDSRPSNLTIFILHKCLPRLREVEGGGKGHGPLASIGYARRQLNPNYSGNIQCLSRPRKLIVGEPTCPSVTDRSAPISITPKLKS